jgi:hypothetical protein
MAVYQVHFFDYGSNVYATNDIMQVDDKAAIEAAHRLHVLPGLGLGFDVWEGERLVHQHRHRQREARPKPGSA